MNLKVNEICSSGSIKSLYLLFIVSNFLFSQYPWSFLFVKFLVVYIFTLPENIIIIALIKVDPQYFFLSNLSFLETWYICVIIPKILDNFLIKDKSITFKGCMTQFYFLALSYVQSVPYWQLWPICGNLQPTTLSNDHDSVLFSATSCRFMASWSQW